MSLNKTNYRKDSTKAETLQMQYVLERLPIVLKTPKNLVVLKTYFLIPQPMVRLFVLTLLTRVTGRANTPFPKDDLSEAHFLLAQYNQLPNIAARDKISALVRQVCVANGGDIGGLYEATR